MTEPIVTIEQALRFLCDQDVTLQLHNGMSSYFQLHIIWQRWTRRPGECGMSTRAPREPCDEHRSLTDGLIAIADKIRRDDQTAPDNAPLVPAG